jgi:hypothetical protein
MTTRNASCAAYVGQAGKDLPVRKLAIRSGYRETFWKRNCVAVGLAAGFLEPLEASAIVLVELSAKLIAEQMPACREVMDLIAARFNATTHYRWGRIIDFLKLHYVLTKRKDSAFWKDNVLPETIPDRLKDLLLLWSHQSPWFTTSSIASRKYFPQASYQYVLYGMGFRTQLEPSALAGDAKNAERAMRENVTQTERLRAGLPRHRDLIRKISRARHAGRLRTPRAESPTTESAEPCRFAPAHDRGSRVALRADRRCGICRRGGLLPHSLQQGAGDGRLLRRCSLRIQSRRESAGCGRGARWLQAAHAAT